MCDENGYLCRIPVRRKGGVVTVAFNVRPARDADMAAVQAIHTHYAEHALNCMPETARTLQEWQTFAQELAACRLPFFVAEAENGIIGFAYISPWKEGSSYRHTGEVSMYLVEEQVGHGLGRDLLRPVLDAALRAGLHQVIAAVADWGDGSAQRARLGQPFGFAEIGVLRRVARKQGRWIDVHLLQLDLAAYRSRSHQKTVRV